VNNLELSPIKKHKEYFMNQPKKLFLLAAFFIFGCCLTDSLAQTPANRPSEPNFDIILQTVIASNDAGKTEVAPSLSGIIKKLKTDFAFSNYRLGSTFIQRVANKGGADSRSISTSEKNLAVFSEWTINNLESSTDENGQQTIQIQNFRFGQRVPINNTTNYEQIGITAKFNLPKNTPTIVGSLTTSKPDELMFLILTVKSAEK